MEGRKKKTKKRKKMLEQWVFGGKQGYDIIEFS